MTRIILVILSKCLLSAIGCMQNMFQKPHISNQSQKALNQITCTISHLIVSTKIDLLTETNSIYNINLNISFPFFFAVAVVFNFNFFSFFTIQNLVILLEASAQVWFWFDDVHKQLYQFQKLDEIKNKVTEEMTIFKFVSLATMKSSISFYSKCEDR